MRRLLFMLSCGALVWMLATVHSAVPARPAQASDEDVMTLVQRTQIVSGEFSRAFRRARAKAHRVNRALNRAAGKLNAVAGD